LLAEPTGTFEIPSDIKASMTKDELYELQALPGYFTPQQTSISNNQQLREQDPQPVKAIVCVDEDMKYYMAVLFEVPPEIITWEDVYNWAENILEGGDDYLEIPFAIDIQAEIFVNWNTPANYDYSDMLSALGTVDPTGVGCDILLLMTAQQDPNYEGLAYSLGRHFVMDCSVGLPANLFQHEASHLFGAPDHGWDFFTYYSTRWYCSGCSDTINDYRFRFD
jgi:hypothetical protein